MTAALLRMWGVAFIVALILAGGRLIADIVIPPHLRWWFTPAVAFIASFLTSSIWILSSKEQRRG